MYVAKQKVWIFACFGTEKQLQLTQAFVINTFVNKSMPSARDMEEITDILRQKDFKAGRYTGQMKPDDQKQADKMFQVGETSVLVAAESYEVRVNNPNINQVIRIGCPRNFLQEIGRAGRKPNSSLVTFR